MFGKKENREGTCPVPSPTPGNEFDVTNGGEECTEFYME